MNSPFIEHITDCKKRMRKLRKKIYKHTITQHDKKPLPKSQDLTATLINIFKKRSIPETIISSLKNKRNIDIFSLKSLVIGNEQQLKWDLPTLNANTSRQEQQVQQLYKQHCERLYEAKKLQTPRLGTRQYATSNYISSTEGDFSSHDSSDLPFSEEEHHKNNDCSQFDEAQGSYQELSHFSHSNEDNIFSEVMLERKDRNCKVQAQAFSSFEMDEMLEDGNIFNF